MLSNSVVIANEFYVGLWIKTNVSVGGKLQIGAAPQKLGCDVYSTV